MADTMLSSDPEISVFLFPGSDPANYLSFNDICPPKKHFFALNPHFWHRKQPHKLL
jgi:hypothetical protein